MKERPILFSAPMVQAILAGRKTQTRRVVKSKRELILIPFAALQSEMQEHLELQGWREWVNGHLGPPCPYGQPGDRLWVRETTEADHNTSDTVTLSRYSADKSPVLYSRCEDHEYNGSVAHWDYPRDVRPSIHMPRWASRINLEITGVRVERLKDISEADAMAEGVWGYRALPTGRQQFEALWGDINGPESWAANPWVWVVEFKRVGGAV